MHDQTPHADRPSTHHHGGTDRPPGSGPDAVAEELGAIATHAYQEMAHDKHVEHGGHTKPDGAPHEPPKHAQNDSYSRTVSPCTCTEESLCADCRARIVERGWRSPLPEPNTNRPVLFS
jgi:hypothetical protein